MNRFFQCHIVLASRQQRPALKWPIRPRVPTRLGKRALCREGGLGGSHLGCRARGPAQVGLGSNSSAWKCAARTTEQCPVIEELR
jgi:hypothetical protein